MSNFDPKDIVRVVQDYTGYIASSCRRYYIIGGTTEDLFQEGVIGLLEACKNYKGETLFEPKFDAFAKKCIHRQIIDSIRHANTLKNKALNEAKTIYGVNENGDEMQTLEILPDRTTVNDPLEIILEKEKTKEQMGICNTTLSEFEKQVLYLRLNGESQSEIAKTLNKDVKSIDNTIQRIKGKLK